jgi:deoxycytidine triphosphate deaminase
MNILDSYKQRLVESSFRGKLPGSYIKQIEDGPPVVPPKYFWWDPNKDASPGLLLSDRIEFYREKVNLIFPYDRQYLRPGSYTIHAGCEYIISPRAGELIHGDLADDKSVVIPPSGLIYIRFFEEVNIPHYLIARFNLRVTQVYRGLLLGTGPQVDPGFRGYLGCPIHNFTDTAKTISFFEDLITIDFEKTTVFAETFLSNMKEVEIKDDMLRPENMKGFNGKLCKTYTGKSGDQPLSYYLPTGESVRSSIYAMQLRVDKFGRQLDRYRRIGIIALIALLIASANMFINAYQNITTSIAELREAVGQLKERSSSSFPPSVPVIKSSDSVVSPSLPKRKTSDINAPPPRAKEDTARPPADQKASPKQ